MRRPLRSSFRYMSCAVTFMTLLPATSVAGKPVNGTVFLGGGAVQGRDRKQLVALGLDRASDRVTFVGYLFDYSRDCGRFKVLIRKGLRVRPDGSFRSASRSAGVTSRVEGRISGLREAAGTAQVTWTKVSANGAPVTCTTGVVHWRVRRPSARLGSGILKAGAVYGGVTSQMSALADVHQPVVLKVAPLGRKVHIAAYLANYCRPKSALVSGSFHDDVPVHNSAFTLHEAFKEPLAPGMTGYFTAVLRGRFGRHVVSGTWKVAAVIRKDADGSVVHRCGGDTKTWQAARLTHVPRARSAPAA